ncbi:tetratricopeptide repeat protein [Commensalibacter papalotli (ex Botero et al. 2024)]|uniref:Tetratricopeptide (TPR) repeat (TPR) (PDB:3AS4) n=1 Tax=Commensalibacter papalotli (ex Botero et al. 2024) TaxID=2972766 RepID=A0ABN8WDH1_9PROT|nr:peptide transporter [Commensalibacter papalotli (ex Botero et al. 2024)]CAI3933431.1 Tetratricopeptide (TPR) repeat (TPR) (PDB:3AS4) [Commensalibacter papalotli (ex Botero et al. 2024)]CAI3942262.1 Tetratricopeptide (TPR) repeat (TPR) (PDB:3AS4) [Commensalibacter papalotli (ex Botero et al. 2024)]
MPNFLKSPDDTFINQTNLLLHQGKFEQALTLLLPYKNHKLSQAIMTLLGIAYAGCNQPKEAAYHLCLAQQLKDSPQRHSCAELEPYLGSYNLYPSIFEVYHEALLNHPKDELLYVGYASVLQQTKQSAKAVLYIKKCLAFSKNQARLLNILATILFEAGKYPQTLKLYSILEKHNENNVTILANLASYHNAVNDTEQALLYYRKAIMLQPNWPALRVNYSICLLKAEYYYQGWVEHEWRLDTPNHSTLPKETLLPTLTDTMDITGKKILITQEEGLGDTLMYLRYVPELIKRGAIVELWIAETMKGLCERLKGKPKVKVGGEEPPPFDWHCPFISLPRALSADPRKDKFKPYLTADRKKVIYWKNKLPQTKQLKVGLVWGGSPHPGEIHAMMTDNKRSIDLSKLIPLLRSVENTTFVSLQMGHYADQIHNLPNDISIFNPMDEVQDMDDTAAILMNLDIIISVDTSVIHLAGGLGCPAILLDRFDNCWRWISGEEYSPWYPKIRIVRQTRPRVWSDVVKKATSILQEMARKHKAT